MKFEYDQNKSLANNNNKHGIDFEEAQALWDDESLLVFPLKFEDEPRKACIGKLRGKHWTAIITYRKTVVRLISVRRSHNEEVTAYEN